MKRIFSIAAVLAVLAVLMVPRLALACPVCFGQSDAPMAKAVNIGIIAMLVVVAGMLATFAAFFIYLNRRARMFAPTETPTKGTA